MNIKDLSFI